MMWLSRRVKRYLFSPDSIIRLEELGAKLRRSGSADENAWERDFSSIFAGHHGEKRIGVSFSCL